MWVSCGFNVGLQVVCFGRLKTLVADQALLFPGFHFGIQRLHFTSIANQDKDEIQREYGRESKTMFNAAVDCNADQKPTEYRIDDAGGFESFSFRY